MRPFRISAKGVLPGNVLQGVLVALIQFRRKVRASVLAEFPNELSCNSINRLANVCRDVEELGYWEQVPDGEMKAHYGDEADATLLRLMAASEYFYNGVVSTKRDELINLCEALNRYFRVVRSCEPDDWDRANKIANDETIPFFHHEREQIDDYCFGHYMDAELLLELTFTHGEQLGAKEGRRRRAMDVAVSGGIARAIKLKVTEEQARAQIRKYIGKNVDDAAQTDEINPRSRARKISASSIASAMIHGEMSELGYRTLANLASEELRAHRTRQSV